MAYAIFNFVIFFTAFLLQHCTFSQNISNITVGTSLVARESSTPWRSPSEDFAFGFQKLQDTNQFMLSIWFDKIPNKTIVWYPKDIGPVSAESTVTIDAQDGLVLSDPRGFRLWTPQNIVGHVSRAFMNDTGNLLLLGSNSVPLWQSFEDPSDTILPTQVIAINGSLVSRRSGSNFNQGRFYLRMFSSGDLVLNTLTTNLDDDAGYYNSHTSDTANSSNSGIQLVFSERGVLRVLLRNGGNSPLTTKRSIPTTSDHYYRATLDFDGVFRQYYHPKSFSGDPGWTVAEYWPLNICMMIKDEGRGACGYYSVCRLENGKPICECPPYYWFSNPTDPYSDCTSGNIPSCGEEYDHNRSPEIVTLADVDWSLSDYQQIRPSTAENCRNACLIDCLCGVSIYRDNSCWKKKLPLSNGRVDTSLGAQAFLKFIPPPKRNGRISKQVIIAIIVAISISLVLLFIGCYYLTRRTRKKSYEVFNENNDEELEISSDQSLQYDINAIVLATNNFSADNKIGEGGFGSVYKGTFSNGQEIAVKRLSKTSGQGAKEFKNEVMLVVKLQHRNLVRLLGFCLETEEKILVYEFVPNKSLDYFLFDREKRQMLNWLQRYKIIGGIARGLLYLHEDSRLRIIHRDLKASNILLDGEMNSKISDFGMAKISGTDQSQENTNRIVGTYGYMSPEYAMHGQFSVKSDVFSFGVLVLEIISGRKNNSFYQSAIVENLISYAWKLWSENRPLELVDLTMQNNYSRNEVLRCIQIGLLCVQENVDDRPNMHSILSALNNDSTTLTIPRRPAFFLVTISQGVPKVYNYDKSTATSTFSINEASISEFYPR